MDLVAIKTQTGSPELHSSTGLLESQPAGERHDEDDQEDDAEKAPADPRSSRVEATAPEDHQKNDQNQQRAHEVLLCSIYHES